MADIFYSEEQKEIIASTYLKNLIDAKPGTGKTTTLIGVAKENFDKSILYLVFSKDLRKKSKTTFPINTEIHTINSFAFSYMKDFIKGKTVVDSIGVLELVSMNKTLSGIFDSNRYAGIIMAKQILEKLEMFFNSRLSVNDFFKNTRIDILSVEIYNFLLTKSNKITHGVILKYFADNYDFSKFDYEIVMVDEAQDMNPVMLLVIEKINASIEFYVGDRKQSIFGFRNLINVFESFGKEYKRFTLTKSFRFGTKISDFISESTKRAYKEDFSMIGNDSIESEVTYGGDRDYGTYCAYISRTNTKLLELAFEEAIIGTDISIPFEWDKIKTLLLDVFNLKIGRTKDIVGQELKHYSDYLMLQTAIEDGYDKELSFLVNIVDNYDLSITEYIQILESQLSSPKYSELILINTHKAKGLEFFNVELADDFADYYSDETSVEEKNMVYVAMSRAIDKLTLNKNLKED